MNLAQLSAETALRLGIKRGMQVIIALSMITNVCLAVTLAIRGNNHRQTIIPPVVHKTFWVDDKSISADYLDQMGQFLLQLALNNTPVSVEGNNKTLLKYVGPGSYGEMEKILAANASRLKENNASSMFSARSITINETERAVYFSGTLTTFVADKRVSDVQKTYLVKFGFSGGRIYLQEMRETDAKEMYKRN